MRIGLLCAAVSLCALVGTPAAAQVQERTIRWGHLNNTDHPVSFGVQKFAEVLAAKSGGKLKIREFAGLATRQRDAAAVGGARRHAGNPLGVDHLARQRRQGSRPVRLPLHRQHVRAGRGAGPGRVRQGDARDAAGEGADRPRLLGARLPQRHQLEPPDREGRGFRRPQAARDPEPGLSRNLQGA